MKPAPSAMKNRSEVLAHFDEVTITPPAILAEAAARAKRMA
jgi:hypothetical protein